MGEFNKIKILEGVKYLLFPRITYNNTIYSALWYTDSKINHILPVTVVENEIIKSYFKVSRGTDGKLTECKSEELPEFVMMDGLTFSPDIDSYISIETGSVILTEGNYFRNDSSADFLRVNGYNVTFAITELSYHLLQIEEGLDVVKFYSMTIDVTENANTMNVRRATVLKGNPFDIILETNGINRYRI